MINVIFLGQVADKLALRQAQYEAKTLFELKYIVLKDLFDRAGLSIDTLKMSVNHELSVNDQKLQSGDEVAFFTAFSGG